MTYAACPFNWWRFVQLHTTLIKAASFVFSFEQCAYTNTNARTYMQAVWLGSSLIPGIPSDKAAWDTVRSILKQDLSEARKVFVAVSPTCVGVVEAKPKKHEHPAVLQKESPDNVTLVLTEHDSTDGLLLA